MTDTLEQRIAYAIFAGEAVVLTGATGAACKWYRQRLHSVHQLVPSLTPDVIANAVGRAILSKPAGVEHISSRVAGQLAARHRFPPKGQ